MKMLSFDRKYFLQIRNSNFSMLTGSPTEYLLQLLMQKVSVTHIWHSDIPTVFHIYYPLKVASDSF